MATSAPCLPGIDIAVMRVPHLSIDDVATLTQPVQISEIDTAIKNIDDNKAPGLDGFNAKFFKTTWPVVKHGVYAAVLEFFSTSNLLRKVNYASITLIPECNNPSFIKDYKPIACCSLI